MPAERLLPEATSLSPTVSRQRRPRSKGFQEFVANKLITHLGTQYDLNHLAGSHGGCDWEHEAVKYSLRAKIVFEDHCYSEELQKGSVAPLGAWCFKDKGGKDRVFCPIRHSQSHSLPKIVGDLFANPRQKVGLTPSQNWRTYSINVQPQVAKGSKYYIFFHVKRRQHGVADPQDLLMHIESAYERARVPGIVRELPFGRLLILMALNGKV